MATLKSINLHLLIPIAAGGALNVSACSPEQSTARNYCKTWKDCDEDSFDDQFDSLSQCVKLVRRQLKAITTSFEVEEGKECSQAFRKQNQCWAKELTCEALAAFYIEDLDEEDFEDYAAWEEDVSETCEDEIEEYYDQCYDDDDYVYDYDF